jgi:type VI secretion system protein VasD
MCVVKLCLRSITILSFFTIVGCSSSKSKVGGVFNLDTDLKLSIIADNSINPDESRRPSPLYLRLYQLKSADSFDKGDFIDIYERDTEVFGGNLVDKTLLKPVIPSEKRSELLILKPGTRYVAIFAEFSNYAGSTYKVIFPVTENNVIKNSVTIEVSDRKISLQKAK